MQPARTTAWTIPGSDGQPIYGDTHEPGGDVLGVLICCHGFKGYKDYGFFPPLCDRAARAGLRAVRFNFSHSGMTNKTDVFERPDLFTKDRWSRQIDDLSTVFASVTEDRVLPSVVFGHSRGGVTSTLFAGGRTSQTLAGLVTAAAPDDACRLDDLAKAQLRAEGRLRSPSGRTGQDLYVGLDWLEEIERDPDRYDPVLAASRLDCPMLILHGDADDTVPTPCAERLQQAAGPSGTLAIVEGANHVFNCPNPAPADAYGSLPEQTWVLIDRTVAFAVSRCAQKQKS
ncbi:MAG: alpha/beta hydrolase [Phycisphaeraceae bacterium]